MKNIKLLIVLFLLLFSNKCLASDNKLSLSQPDRQLHFVFSAQGSALISLLAKDNNSKLKGPLVGFISMTAIGVAKEFLYDKKASGGDIKADVLGSITGSLLVFTATSF